MGFGVWKGDWVELSASDSVKKATSGFHVCLREDDTMAKVEGDTKRPGKGIRV